MQTSGTQNLNMVGRLQTLRYTMYRDVATILIQQSRVPTLWHPDQAVRNAVKGHRRHWTIAGRWLEGLGSVLELGRGGLGYGDGVQGVVVAVVGRGTRCEKIKPDGAIISAAM